MYLKFNGPGQNGGPLSRLLAALIGILVLGAALMFSLVFFAVLAVAGLLFWLYFWWKTRALRRQMREQSSFSPADFAMPTDDAPTAGEVIEGEAIRVPDEHRQLPR